MKGFSTALLYIKPKSARAFAAAVSTGLISMPVLLFATTIAEAGLPAYKYGKASQVSPQEAQVYFEQAKPAVAAPLGTLAPELAAASTPEIREMARALKNDPDLIYQYVYDLVEYTPIYGSCKGATGTLLDGKGNDFDQSSLMIALLRQAGFTANYVYGVIRVYPAQLTNWLGSANASALGSVLGSAGIPSTNYINPDHSLAFVEIDHVWVKAHIETNDYVFDPSLKTNAFTAGINLTAAMGYNQAVFLSNSLAGSTLTADYIQNVDRSRLRDSLTGYATNLINSIRSNYWSATMDQIIGGKSTIPVQTFPRQTSLPYQRSITYQWSDIPNQYKTSLRVQHLGIDLTLFSEDIYGKRLTIFYDGANQPVLRLDGDTLATGFSVGIGSSEEVVLSVDHPYAADGGTYGDDTQTSYVTVGGTNCYFIVNGWAGTRRHQPPSVFTYGAARN